MLPAALCSAVAMARRFSFLFIFIVQSVGCAPAHSGPLSTGTPLSSNSRAGSKQAGRRSRRGAHLGAEDHAAARAQRRAHGTHARIAGALLRIRLAPAAADLGPRQRARRPLRAARQVGTARCAAGARQGPTARAAGRTRRAFCRRNTTYRCTRPLATDGSATRSARLSVPAALPSLPLTSRLCGSATSAARGAGALAARRAGARHAGARSSCGRLQLPRCGPPALAGHHIGLTDTWQAAAWGPLVASRPGSSAGRSRRWTLPHVARARSCFVTDQARSYHHHGLTGVVRPCSPWLDPCAHAGARTRIHPALRTRGRSGCGCSPAAG